MKLTIVSRRILTRIGYTLLVLFALIGIGVTALYLGIRLHLTDLSGVTDQQAAAFYSTEIPMATSTEWAIFKTAVLRDADLINTVASTTGIQSRLLVSQLFVEQMRMFYTRRGFFESKILPKGILARAAHTSLGVLGMKPEAARAIEDHLKDPSSPYYLGPEFEKILDFPPTTGDREVDRFARMTQPDDRSYSYLYGALYNKQIMAQWKRAGFDISDRPEILATLYNIGFAHSEPKANPQSGGAELEINGTRYSFGRLAAIFYYSDELLSHFPR